ncbi:hypothetical protein Cpha266_0932 [Chlorobium phaeobacteroides DSM 266]|uniref:Uncharacterized protein n=1 Tax=Chlorobium phaeobacteroides (strain DSM 266 / SMG 266 / 2430) TaxID=290317 RepID=A1BF03_CHLPD|nr:hypothetical protein Cpha266_0932 [Chlorobium phaeobacteroides DSM 266]
MSSRPKGEISLSFLSPNSALIAQVSELVSFPFPLTLHRHCIEIPLFVRDDRTGRNRDDRTGQNRDDRTGKNRNAGKKSG